MSEKYGAQINDFMDKVKAKNGHESEFLQAVEEVAEAIIPFIGTATTENALRQTNNYYTS